MNNEPQKSRIKTIDVKNIIVHFWLATIYNFMSSIALKYSLLLHYAL